MGQKFAHVAHMYAYIYIYNIFICFGTQIESAPSQNLPRKFWKILTSQRGKLWKNPVNTEVSMGFGSRCPAILGGTLCLLANRCNRCGSRCHVKSKRRFDARFSRSVWMSWTAATSTGHSRKLVSLWCCSLWWLEGDFCGVSVSSLSWKWDEVFADVESARALGSFFVETCSGNLDCLGVFHVLWNVCFGYGRAVFLW